MHVFKCVSLGYSILDLFSALCKTKHPVKTGKTRKLINITYISVVFFYQYIQLLLPNKQDPFRINRSQD